MTVAPSTIRPRPGATRGQKGTLRQPPGSEHTPMMVNPMKLSRMPNPIPVAATAILADFTGTHSSGGASGCGLNLAYCSEPEDHDGGFRSFPWRFRRRDSMLPQWLPCQ